MKIKNTFSHRNGLYLNILCIWKVISCPRKKHMHDIFCSMYLPEIYAFKSISN